MPVVGSTLENVAQQLTAMKINRMALVDKGANGREFAILKRADAMPALPAVATPEADRAGLLDRITKAIAGALHAETDVAKAQTFGTIIAGRELTDALYDSWSTLQDSLWAAIWAVDADGVDLPLKTKTALVAANLDEFKAWLLAQMDTGIAKRDLSPEADAQAIAGALVRKVGKKISGTRLEKLQAALDALASVIAEASEVETEKRAAPAQEDDMTSEELTKAMQPFADRLDAIEKKLTAAEPVKKTDNEPGPDKDPDEDGDAGVAPAWAEAIVERVENIEKLLGRGQRTSAAGDETVKKGNGEHWSKGIL